MVQKKDPKNWSKNSPKKESPLVQGFSGPVHILPYGYFLWQTDFRIILRLLS